jgi:hypothetical protein
MRTYKLLLREIDQKDKWGTEDKDAIKLGEVAYPFKGKVDDELLEFEAGQKLYFQYGTKGVFNGEELTLVSLNSIVRDFE